MELIERLHRGSLDPAQATELAERRARLDARISTLNEFVSAMASGNGADLLAAAREAEEAELQRKRVGSCGDYVKLATTVVRRTVSGVLTVYLYFMDLISDVKVTLLLFFAFKGCSADCMVGTDIDLLRAAPDAGY